MIKLLEMGTRNKSLSVATLRIFLGRFSRSTWLFPAILLIPLILFTIFKVSGSSIGVYHALFYGNTKDSNLIAGTPRLIRGDEWNSDTQLALAQHKNDYSRINHNIGGGEDLSLLEDLPYKDWSIIFRPHNLAFLVLPFDNAFAFRWWLMLYLLIVSCYLFVLALLPGKRLLASILAIGFAFNPMIQWWYLYGTLGSLYYTLFTAVLFMAILNARTRLARFCLGALLAYVLVCFMLVLYPPFQISCALAVAAFAVGYFIEKLQRGTVKSLIQPLAVVVSACIVAGIIALAFVLTRESAVHAITHTSYPGARVVDSGDFSLSRLLSGQLSSQLTNTVRQQYYTYYVGSNQSEASNFILLLPFLFLPGVLLLIKGYKTNKKLDWPLLTTSVLFVLLLIRLYIPHTSLLFKPLLLGSVPLSRMLIGVGLLSFIHMALVIRNLSRLKKLEIPRYITFIYVFMVWVVCAVTSVYIHKTYPGFIGLPKAILFSIPIPVIVYLFLVRRFNWGALVLCAFLVFCGAGVNPLYKGTAVITDTPLSKAIQTISATSTGRWITDSITYEQFPVMNGAHSLTGVYAYPQLDLWKASGAPEDTYNRYAHIYALPDTNINEVVPSRLVLKAPDTIAISSEPCSNFMHLYNVRFILTRSPLYDTCLSLERIIKYPSLSFYIYKIDRYEAP